jgi:NPCBM-associated, NEW3 domain of alpha-galactosidase
MTAGKRVRVPVLLLVLAAVLVFAATASAETRAGESTTVATDQTPTAEATILKATAFYETSGNAAFEVTAAGPPSAGGEGEMWAALVTSPDCEAPSDRLSLINTLFTEAASLILLIRGNMAVAGAVGITGNLLEAKPVTAAKSVSGTTSTFTGTSSEIANREFNCAIIGASDGEEFQVGEGEGEGRGSSFIAIPLVTQAEPPPPPTSGPSSSGSSSAGGSQASPSPGAAAPAPPVLSIARLKPLTLKTGKWQSVSVKVTNTGAGASAAGSLRLKAPKGLLAKPERQQLPALAPGRTFTLSFRVQLTAKAKKKTIVSVTASAPGASATASLALKLKQ